MNASLAEGWSRPGAILRWSYAVDGWYPPASAFGLASRSAEGLIEGIAPTIPMTLPMCSAVTSRKFDGTTSGWRASAPRLPLPSPLVRPRPDRAGPQAPSPENRTGKAGAAGPYFGLSFMMAGRRNLSQLTC
jgi:hypothetical protein